MREAAYIWIRHRWVVPYTAAVFAALVLLTPIATIDEWATRIVIGLAGGAVAVGATTDYFVLALVEDGLVLCTASRIRQVARALAERLPGDTRLEPAGGTMLVSDWQIGDRRYTVPRSSEQPMQRIAAMVHQ